MRFYRSPSTYPGYKHLSFNGEFGDGEDSWVHLRLTLHVRYRFARTFYLTLMPEVNLKSGMALNRQEVERKYRG